MAIGLGIHGEPGIDETGIPTADGLAELLVSRLLDELPDGIETAQGARVVPILNGLGSLKYEEMFVVYRRIAAAAHARRAPIIVDPHVGEYCTSFDMAGTSLTLFWLDDELDAALGRPGRHPRLPPRLGRAGRPRRCRDRRMPRPPPRSRPRATPPARPPAWPPASSPTTARHRSTRTSTSSAGSTRSPATATTASACSAERALRATPRPAPPTQGAGAGTVLVHAGDAWSDRAGGTSGALWGVILRAVGEAIGDEDAPSAASVAAGVAAASAGVMAYGKAEVGDKTMVDALVPFSAELTRAVDAGARSPTPGRPRRSAATPAAASTADLLPRMGRARPHAEKSLGTPDPGAHSLALIATAIGALLADAADERN